MSGDLVNQDMATNIHHLQTRTPKKKPAVNTNLARLEAISTPEQLLVYNPGGVHRDATTHSKNVETENVLGVQDEGAVEFGSASPRAHRPNCVKLRRSKKRTQQKELRAEIFSRPA